MEEPFTLDSFEKIKSVELKEYSRIFIILKNKNILVHSEHRFDLYEPDKLTIIATSGYLENTRESVIFCGPSDPFLIELDNELIVLYHNQNVVLYIII